MEQCNLYITDLQKALDYFVDKGKIEMGKIEGNIRKLEKLLKGKQLQTLFKPINDDEQNALFNAFRNVRIIINEMEEQLRTAFKRKENPATAERCNSLTPFIINLCDNIEEFQKNIDGSAILDISRKTRILRKKAKQYNLLPSLEKEMREVNLSRSEIKSFLNELNDKIISEMEEL